VLDKERKLRYRGRIDDSRDPSNVTTSDLRNAINDLLEGKELKLQKQDRSPAASNTSRK